MREYRRLRKMFMTDVKAIWRRWIVSVTFYHTWRVPLMRVTGTEQRPHDLRPITSSLAYVQILVYNALQ